MTEFLYSELSYKLRGSFFAVYKSLGSFHRESVYQKALVSEFSTNGIFFEREVELPVIYVGEEIGKYRADFIIEERIIVEVKAVEKMHPVFDAQLLTYLKLTKRRLGLLINFNVPLIRDGIERIVL